MPKSVPAAPAGVKNHHAYHGGLLDPLSAGLHPGKPRTRETGKEPEGLRLWNLQVSADLPSEKVIQLIVSRHSRYRIGSGIHVDAVSAPLTEQGAPVFLQVANQIAALHPESTNGSRITFSP